MATVYTYTNEHLGAIVNGLDTQLLDNILAVGGSGDQAFALLEKAGKVSVIDTNSAQMDLIKERAELLRLAKFDEFLDIEFGSLVTPKSFLAQRNNYFMQEGRMDRIKANLSNLIFPNESEPKDVFEFIKDKSRFNKIYLSNVLGYHQKDKAVTLKESLSKIADALPVRGLIYLANYDDLAPRNKGFNNPYFIDPRVSDLTSGLYSDVLIYGDLGTIPPAQTRKREEAPFVSLPDDLRLDVELTRIARSFDSWFPAVLRKVEGVQQ